MGLLGMNADASRITSEILRLRTAGHATCSVLGVMELDLGLVLSAISRRLRCLLIQLVDALAQTLTTTMTPQVNASPALGTATSARVP